ncbi:hypothetical protein [Deinococcus fonticola]|nr:hypothetical protein [Deinococcus fonticola]
MFAQSLGDLQLQAAQTSGNQSHPAVQDEECLQRPARAIILN